MKLSTKGRYSTQFMIDLAVYGIQDKPVLLKDVARRQEISEKYLGHLVPLLKSARLINATRGANGGFTLAKPAKAITWKDIIVAVEGAITLADQKKTASGCWAKATAGIISVLQGFSLEDMASEYKEAQRAVTYDI
jgi:Rrf2 family protein